jgi:hypothetical protein
MRKHGRRMMTFLRSSCHAVLFARCYASITVPNYEFTTTTTTMRQTVVVSGLLALVGGSLAFVPSSSTARPAFYTLASTVDDKTEVREYFNTEGFNRWNKIYSESEDVNSVQLDIRTGHDQTIQKILKWVKSDGDIAGKTVCDCGCGVGSLAIPLAQMGKCFPFDLSLSVEINFFKYQSQWLHSFISRSPFHDTFNRCQGLGQ